MQRIDNKKLGKVIVKDASADSEPYIIYSISLLYDNSSLCELPKYKLNISGALSQVNWDIDNWRNEVICKLKTPSYFPIYDWRMWYINNYLDLIGYSTESFTSEPNISYLDTEKSLSDFIENNWLFPIFDEYKYVYPIVDFKVEFVVDGATIPHQMIRNGNKLTSLPSGYVWRDGQGADANIVTSETIVTQPMTLYGTADSTVTSAFEVTVPALITLGPDSEDAAKVSASSDIGVKIVTVDNAYSVNVTAAMSDLSNDANAVIETSMSQDRSRFGLGLDGSVTASSTEADTYFGTSNIKITAPKKVGSWSGNLHVAFSAAS